MKEVIINKINNVIKSVSINGTELRQDKSLDGNYAVHPSMLRGLSINELDPGLSLILRSTRNDGMTFPIYPVDVQLKCLDQASVQIVFSRLETKQPFNKHKEAKYRNQFRAVVQALENRAYNVLKYYYGEKDVDWLDYFVIKVADVFDPVIDYIESVIQQARSWLPYTSIQRGKI